MKTHRILPSHPALLILKEKHDVVFFLVSDEEELFRIALRVLTTRHQSGYWYGPDTNPEPKIEMPIEAIEALPEGETREMVEAVHRSQRRALGLWKKTNAEWERIVDVVQRKDGADAWRVLESRSDYEYEGVSLERFVDPRLYSGG